MNINETIKLLTEKLNRTSRFETKTLKYFWFHRLFKTKKYRVYIAMNAVVDKYFKENKEKKVAMRSRLGNELTWKNGQYVVAPQKHIEALIEAYKIQEKLSNGLSLQILEVIENLGKLEHQLKEATEVMKHYKRVDEISDETHGLDEMYKKAKQYLEKWGKDESRT